MSLLAAAIEQFQAHPQAIDRFCALHGKVVPSSILDARQRLGPKPLSHLFNLLFKEWTKKNSKATWHGLQLFEIDGTAMAVPDANENLDHFGKPGSLRGEVAYPKIRAVAVMDSELRILHSAKVGTLK